MRSELPNTYAARDTIVYYYDSGKIIIANSAIKNNPLVTYDKREAKRVLLALSFMGDEIPWSAIEKING
jgi:hypothetical protein